jgi:hypothetical protein
VVSGCKLQDAHGDSPVEGVSASHGGCISAANSAPLVTGTPSSIGWECLARAANWLFCQRHPILGAIWFAFLTACLFLHWTGLALVAVVLGQFGEFVRTTRRG